MPVLPIGTLVNVASVIAGSAIGLAFRARFPERVRDIVFQGLGLATLVIGLRMALGFQQPLLLIFSILIGGIIGAAVRFEDFLASLGERLKRVVKSDNALFTDGLITAFLLFCVGSMTILGAFDEGLRGDPTLLYTKSLLDGFAAIALASTYGTGVIFSAVPLFLYQYGLTLAATALKDVLPPPLLTEMTAVGGLLIVGIGINLLKLRYIQIGNLLPSLLIIVILATIFM
jgi:uncharacterized membrane protein YqgA involved in biofilm formation